MKRDTQETIGVIIFCALLLLVLPIYVWLARFLWEWALS